MRYAASLSKRRLAVVCLLVVVSAWGLHAQVSYERLRRAAVYAALSVRTATGAASAPTLYELDRALVEFPPSTLQPASAKEAS